ncbi:MAG: sulfurtransferase [Piscinibacter sp.]|nr:sulfurtransferase [Piscinibacter sp.]
MDPILNVSAYRFVELDDPTAWQARIRTRAAADALKGTVLLAREGLNLFLAGPAPALRGFVAWLREAPAFAALEVKESWSAETPFRRLKVKVKREIIRMNHPTIRPQQARAPALDAATLARWLERGHDDAGRAVVTLDTRNAFEVDGGRFAGALDWRLDRFSDFPAAALAHREALAGKTVVSYCTGGIRCEKAALFLQEAGIGPVWQLDGGLLKYFELTGGRHFEGSCFVFDERESLDTALRPARSV